MSTSSELMYAILSMDAYNRGYNQGLVYEGNSIGTATVTLQSDISENGEAVAADFYAVAYEWNGETIVSYRGTDNPLFELPLVDYPIAGNNDFDEAQVHLGVQFFNEVAAATGSNAITTTGHSLGGALSGFVGTLYGQQIVAVDPIDFFPALLNFKALIDQYLLVKDTPEASSNTIHLPGMGTFNTVAFAEAQLAAMGISVNEIPTISNQLQNYTSFYLSGSIAIFAREEATPSTPTLDDELPNIGLTVGLIDAHSASLNVIVKYVEQQHALNGVNELNFVPIINPLFDALFDDEIAVLTGTGTIQGVSEEHTKMRDAIAYSALEGSEGLVFGNTGIRAMFNDANELGKLVTEGKVPTAHANPIPGLSEAIVQFAGQMALNKVNYLNEGQNLFPELGFLSAYNSNGRDFLFADLSKQLWNLGSADPDQDLDIKGIQTILDSFFSNEAQGAEGQASEMLAAMEELYGSDKTSTIERIDFVRGTRFGVDERLAA